VGKCEGGPDPVSLATQRQAELRRQVEFRRCTGSGGAAEPKVAMDVLVVSSFEDFDETLEKRQRGPGNGRKHANQALVHHLGIQPEVAIRKVDLVVLDWKTPPKQGPKDLNVSLHKGASEKQALWGSRDQLLSKLSASVWDVVICTQARRLALDFAAQLKARKHVTMLHDYNLPFGPWGQEQTEEQLREHRSLCEGFEVWCASSHLADFVGTWSECRCRATCCYAADYGYFEPMPAVLSPWENTNTYVTLINPCPEKGMCVLARLASRMPETRFLAVCTPTWTKPWHEQLLKRYSNVKLQAPSAKIDEILGVTRVLIVPSLWPEAFGLVAVEAQLRGIPVISSGVCGLREATLVPSMVAEIPIVYDQRTHELVVGMAMSEATDTLPVDRSGALTMEQSRQTVVAQESCQRIADDADVEAFAARLQALLGSGEDTLREASREAREAACAFVEGRQERLMQQLVVMMEEVGDAKPAPLTPSGAAPKYAPPPKVRGPSLEDEEEPCFDTDQDFTQMKDFDGSVLAARVLVRLCEQGNLTVAAELIQAKANINMSEPEIGVVPLIAAANAGHVDICKYLLRKEADVNLVVRDGTERTALHAASHMGFASVVQLLLERRANPRVEDLTKTTCLHLAVHKGHAGATDLLLHHKANPNQSDDQGQVPINDAVAKDRFDLVTKLLEHGSLVNVRNMAGLEAISFSRTPRMQALIMKNDINF